MTWPYVVDNALGSVVHLRSAVVLIGRFPALAGINLDVDQGELCLIRGENGAGKTTLLRLLAGLAGLTEGTAVVLGNDLALNRTAHRANIGLLGHATMLYDDLSVKENIAFWGRAAGATVQESHAALERLAVPQRLHDLPVRALSAGQRRRVSLAVMVARRPQLWLLDEPHAGLDAAGRDLIDSLMDEAVGAGATVMFASHELDRATAVAHREVVIGGGVVIHDGANSERGSDAC